MTWKIGDAKQHFSEVIRDAAEEPQLIYNRDKPVAAVIASQRLAEYLAWEAAQRRPSMAERLAEARRICAEEEYRLETPARADRENPLLAEKPRAPRRHKRR